VLFVVVVVGVVASAGLSAAAQTDALSVTGSEQTVSPGDSVSTSFTVVNNGTSARTAVALNASTPDGWTIEEQSGDGASFKSATATWLWLKLPANATETVTLAFDVPADASGQYDITSTVSDADSYADSATSSVVVRAPTTTANPDRDGLSDPGDEDHGSDSSTSAPSGSQAASDDDSSGAAATDSSGTDSADASEASSAVDGSSSASTGLNSNAHTESSGGGDDAVETAGDADSAARNAVGNATGETTDNATAPLAGNATGDPARNQTTSEHTAGEEVASNAVTDREPTEYSGSNARADSNRQQRQSTTPLTTKERPDRGTEEALAPQNETSPSKSVDQIVVDAVMTAFEQLSSIF
jgi:hypothetical protein